MHPNAALIHRFYEAFQQHDGEAMARCYASDVHFSDPVFTGLSGARAGDMWRMLTARAADLELRFDGVEADDAAGSAHWVASYTFSASRRHVVNDIQASFTFRDGLILTHTDRFDLWKWTRQALGVPGVLLGWTPFLQDKVRRQAADGLSRYIEQRAARA